ncbi:hypothetical protein [Glycomyces albidus]|uniref:hypothetical protein n=1 Tax=Glycomyces albidus TaxID=2656774 RepID=UPI0012905A37|nr:hypothetical protein [Glycomyces albidus]
MKNTLKQTKAGRKEPAPEARAEREKEPPSGYSDAAGWSAGRLRAQTTNAPPRRTRVWSDPQTHRVHTVAPEALRCRDTVVTGSSSGQPQYGQQSITVSSSQGIGTQNGTSAHPPAPDTGITLTIEVKVPFVRATTPGRRWFAKLIVKPRLNCAQAGPHAPPTG